MCKNMIMRSLFIIILGLFYYSGYAQIINFPDPNFKNALVNTKCVDTNEDSLGDADVDLNDDGEIDVSEALKVSELNVSNRQISSMRGIENFKNLTLLICSYNKLDTLEVQMLTKLMHLDCGGNQLLSLEIKNLVKLKVLFCYKNGLTELEVKELINLEVLHCSENQITSLEVVGLLNLKELYCGANKLGNLEVKNFLKLEIFDCGENNLTNLDIKGSKNLVTFNCESNQLNMLDIHELNNLNFLNCYENQLTSLEVKNSANLLHLDCRSNQLSTLEVQDLKNLEYLICRDNILESLAVQDLKNLEFLDCSLNKLTTLDAKDLPNLEYLSCSDNLINAINVKGAINLYRLDCSGNQLISLDVHNLLNLAYLSCAKNQIDSLIIHDALNLTELNCFLNKLKFLDVTNLNKLKSLNCVQNQLTHLLVKGAKLDQNFEFRFNPNLNYICCDDNIITDIINKALSYGMMDIEVNSYCSFTPGGVFYTVAGLNSQDINMNGCDEQDLKISSIKFIITNGNISGTFVANSTGNYTIPFQEGTHTITPILEYPNYFEVSPPSYTITFPNTTDTVIQNYCITSKNAILRQTNIIVIPLIPPARPGFEAKYKIIWQNVGNQIEGGTLNFTYDETLLDYISATQAADQVADGIIKWNFSNLQPFEKREITVTLKVNRPTDTPAVNAGDKLYMTASILDNIFTLENTVVGSYDPNDKTCLQGDRVHPDMIGKYVDYLIRFENTGTYAAENVVVKDIIDTKRYDVSTLQITDASHEVYTRIEGNKVEFIFENIQLPFDDANNDGYIAFKIKTLSTLQLGDSLKNLADIYFDYNFPIRTNEAQTTVALPSFTQDWVSDVNVYPNPVSDIIHLQTEETWTKAEIFDVSGRIMRAESLSSQSIDVSTLESGTYFVRLRNGDRVGRVKFVKM